MSAADGPSSCETAAPLSAQEAAGVLLPVLSSSRKVLLAVSGGPDSTALLHLAVEVSRSCPRGHGRLVCATVDHGLRPESASEAGQVAGLCARLGVPHRTLRWEGEKPRSGIQAAARAARYALLLDLAQAEGGEVLALAHTQDDQAETVLFRLMRGSGVTGLAGMQAEAVRSGIRLWRPFLGTPKARLVATLDAAGIPFFRDPSNTDVRFARPRLRKLAPQLEAEGLDAARLSLLARRMARADAALEAATDAAQAVCAATWPQAGAVEIHSACFAGLPAEVGLRLLQRAIAQAGHEGPAELAKLEALAAALAAHLEGVRHSAASSAALAFRRTLAGALVSVVGEKIRIGPAPERRKAHLKPVNRATPAAPSLAKEGGGPKLATGRFER